MITISYQGQTLDQIYKRYDPAIVEKALSRSKNRVMDKSATALNKKLREKYYLLARDVNKTLKKHRSIAAKKNDAVLEYVGPRLPLSMFSPAQKNIRVTSRKTGKTIRRKGVTVRIKKGAGRVLIKSIPAFLTRGGTEVSYRKDENRESYRTPTVLSVPEMITFMAQRKEFDRVVSREFQPEFESNMNFYLGVSR
jgi:hypothetical protein